MEKLLTAEQVAAICKIKVAKAYQIIRELNEELKAKGFIIIRGRVNKNYLYERLGIKEDNYNASIERKKWNMES